MKLIIICVFLYFILRWIWRVLSPAIPTTQEPVELKACEFCGTLVRVDKGVKFQGRIFCSQDHANRMHQA